MHDASHAPVASSRSGVLHHVSAKSAAFRKSRSCAHGRRLAVPAPSRSQEIPLQEPRASAISRSHLPAWYVPPDNEEGFVQQSGMFRHDNSSIPARGQCFKPGSEVPQKRRLMDDPIAGDRIPMLENIQDDLDHVVDVALRIDAPRYREAHQLHSRGISRPASASHRPNITEPISTERIPPAR